MFCAINHSRKEDFDVVWDLGRRCTYECTYCDSHRSSKTSPFVSLDSLKKTLDGIVEYSNLLQYYRQKEMPVGLAFTGGEPTAHPEFFDFLKYCKHKYPNLRTNLTTNGCYSKRKAQLVMETCHSTTLSYHAEATDQEKKLVKDNIILMSENNYNFRINVMFHVKYFDECKKLCDWLDDIGVKYTARPIGDSNNASDVADGTAHAYTKEQLEYFKNQWSNKQKKKVTSSAMQMAAKTTSIKSIGRPCCNGKCLNLKMGESWETGYRVPSTNFKDWHCMVNWYFLYINSELDAVYHHQTCQVNLEGKVGPIGRASNFSPIIDKLKQKLRSGIFPVIKCPKFHCGCGLCAPKALEESTASDIFYEHTKHITPSFTKESADPGCGKTIYGMFKNLDAGEKL